MKKTFLFIMCGVLALTLLSGCGNEKKENIEKTDNKVGENKTVSLKTGEIESKFYGDFIDYGIDLNNDGNTKNDWKIFYDNGEYTYIIASEFIESSKIPTNMHMKLLTSNSNIYAYWDNSYINNEMKELQGNLQERFMLGQYELDSSKENSKVVSTILNTINWEDYINEYSDYAIGSPTLNMWISSWNSKYNNDKIDSQVANNGYKIKNKSTSNFEDSIKLESTKGYEDKLYYPSHENSNYWIASTGDDGQYIYHISSSGELESTYYGMGGAFRPVVSLKNNLNLIKNNNIWTIEK